MTEKESGGNNGKTSKMRWQPEAAGGRKGAQWADNWTWDNK